MEPESKALQIFFLFNMLLSLSFFIVSLAGIFIPRDAAPDNFLNLAVWILMGIPFYFSIVPLFTFLFRRRINSIFVGVITFIWIIFLIFILLISLGAVTQAYFSLNTIQMIKNSEKPLYVAIRILAAIMGLFMIWFLISGKKSQEESKSEVWIIGLLSIMCGLFFVLLGFLLIFMPSIPVLTRFLGVIVIWLIGIIIWFGGYSMMKR